MKKILFIFGTRPEAIKMAPLIKEIEKHKNDYKVNTCITAQHREMLDQILEFFMIKPDFDLNLMKPDQSLFDVTTKGLKGIEDVLNKFEPDIIFVQGDTATAFIGALAGYYKKIKVAHLEAGLRSYNKYSPYPEELNRVLTGHLADYHFAPTKKAFNNLRNENITKNVWIVGNTVIDALFMGLKLIQKEDDNKYKEFFNYIDFSKKIILVTGHRRESFGTPFENICKSFKKIIDAYNDVEIVYPVHLNPNVRKPVYNILKNYKRIHLIEPLSYQYLIWLMNKSYFVLTDSGGIQEEAPSLGKPVLILRDVTERTEGIKAGNAKLVGTNIDRIFSGSQKLLDNKNYYKKMSNAINPYGDGKTSQKIVKILKKIIS